MNWYQVLKVSENATLKDCKRSYVKLIKEYRPDEHPEEFMKIRAAYESAQHFFKNLTTEVKPVFEPPKFKNKNLKNDFDFNNTAPNKEKKLVETYDLDLSENEYECANTLEYQENDLIDKVPIIIELQNSSDDNYELNATDSKHEKPVIDINTTSFDRRDDIKNVPKTDVHHCSKLLDELYAHHVLRFKLDAWIDLFNALTLYQDEIMGDVLCHFLNTHDVIPTNVWVFLNDKYMLDSHPSFLRKERIQYPSAFNYRKISYHNEINDTFFSLQNKLYYYLLELEDHDPKALKEDIYKLESITFLDHFYYELVLKFALLTNDIEIFDMLTPSSDIYDRFKDSYYRQIGYYYLNNDNIEKANVFFETSDKYSVDDSLYETIKYKLKLIKEAHKPKPKRFNFTSSEHVLVNYYGYTKSSINKLRNKPIDKQASSEKFQGNLWAFLIVGIMCLLAFKLIGFVIKILLFFGFKYKHLSIPILFMIIKFILRVRRNK